MSSRRTADALGRTRAREVQLRLAREIRLARLDNGLSLTAAAGACGMSPAQLGRIERAQIAALTIEQSARAASAVGLRLVVQVFPDEDAARDTPQHRVLGRFWPLLPPAADWATEVGLPIPGDRRAWDALVRLDGRRAGIEAESKLYDVQAMERRLALKFRDGGVDVMIVLVANTASNRAVLAARRESLRGLLPLDGPAVLAALRSGHLPAANGLVLI